MHESTSLATLLAADAPPWLVAAAAFLFGALWGSFFNVAIYRWPLEMSVVTPPSHCPACGARVPWRLNLPIASFLILRGKAACCGAPLSPRYPIVEALSAVLCLALAQKYVVGAPVGTSLLDATLVTSCYFAFVGGLLVATFADLEHMEIPDEVSLPGAALGLATASFRDPEGVEAAALGAGLGFLLIQVVFVWIYEHMTGRRGMGEGDAKFMLMIGAFEGWRGVAFALFAGAVQGLVAFVLMRLGGRELAPERDAEATDAPEDGAAGEAETDADPEEPPPAWVGHHKLPFGPFLALGALEFLFFGEQVIDAWLEFVGRATAG